MKLPISWLRDYVEVELDAAELTRGLTFSGIEVEGVETVGLSGRGIVVGEVLAVRPHPRADRLRLCDVSDGTATLPVVCGAGNVVAGAKVALAPVGATLGDGTRIREARLRGELSRGMLCAEDELGLSDDHSGILVLPADAAPGTPLASVVGPPETVLHLEVTWNRPDCLSVIGIAREVAALWSVPLRLPPISLPEGGGDVGEAAAVEVHDPQGCPRYTARLLRGVRIGPSPAWMQRRLALSGVRPISNVVDITNYVMLECGQPLHAFDYRLLERGRIVVRRAEAGETIRTLDGVDRATTPEMLMICDASRPVAVAGIMGGEGSEIRDDTQAVLLESAVFDPAGIHRTSVALGLATESSHRFERGVDPEGAEWASRRAAALMVAHAGAVAARGVLDVRRPPAPPREIACRYARVRDVIGIDIADGDIAGIFDRLGLSVVARGTADCRVRVPPFRLDLELEADLIEEVARIHGLEGVPAAVPAARVVPDADDPRTRAVAACRHALIGLGLSEAMHYSFLAPALLDLFDPADADRRVVLPNPVSADHSVLRHSLLPQMVETLGRNLAHQNLSAALFEIGRVFRREPDGAIREEERLSIGLMGPVGRTGPDGNRPVGEEEMFLWVKGVVEALAAARHVPVAFSPAAFAGLEDGCCVEVTSAGEPWGVLGLAAARVRHEWRMGEPVGVAELRLDPLCATADRVSPAPVSAYPAVRRDFAVIVDEAVRHSQIVEAIRKNAPPELTAVSLFDIFKGEGIGKGRKSLAYTLVYRSHERSLTDEEVNLFHVAVTDALTREVGAELRDG